MSKYNEKIEDIQEYIKNTEVTVEFNDGTIATLPLKHISINGVCVKHSAFCKKNDITNAYPYKVLEIKDND